MKVIPCPHESGAVDNLWQGAPNHHPLTKEEIAELLNEAVGSENPLTSQIQVRLCQGIPGYVCPDLAGGPVAEKATEIGRLYVGNFHRGADPELVDRIYEIMTR